MVFSGTAMFSKLHFTSIVMEDPSEIFGCGPSPFAAIIQQLGGLVVGVTHGIIHKPIGFVKNAVKAEGRNCSINVITWCRRVELTCSQNG